VRGDPSETHGGPAERANSRFGHVRSRLGSRRHQTGSAANDAGRQPQAALRRDHAHAHGGGALRALGESGLTARCPWVMRAQARSRSPQPVIDAAQQHRSISGRRTASAAARVAEPR